MARKAPRRFCDDEVMATGWVLDELDTAGRENLDPSHVVRYDDKEDARAAEEVALLTSLGLDHRSTVIDFGAGTGQFTVVAAAAFRHVIAVDISPLMLDQLGRKVAGARLDNVEIVRAGFVTYEHHRAPVDAVYSRWALHHLPDFWKAVALARMRQVTRPGGLLRLSDIVYSFSAAEAEHRIEAWCASLPTTAPDGEWVRGDIEEHVRDEHSTFTWLLEPMIERAGFLIEQARYSDDQIFADYVARAAE
jgi:SAM-dependent methyltransferase